MAARERACDPTSGGIDKGTGNFSYIYMYKVPAIEILVTIVTMKKQHKIEASSRRRVPLRPIKTNDPQRRLKKSCDHQIGSYKKMCFQCGEMVEESGVSIRYIRDGLMLNPEEINRMCESDMESHKKLNLVLDLDHTLLNSTFIKDMTSDEDYLIGGDNNSLLDLFTVESMGMVTKLRPFVRSFLREANEMFVMHIYTMGNSPYAREMAKLLDPNGVYFSDRIISRDDGTESKKKSLDVVLANVEAVVIVDDTKDVWSQQHQRNVIEIQRYHFFASSCKQFSKSLSELRTDESGSSGQLSTILNDLKRIHRMFFNNTTTTTSKDVRSLLRQAS